MDKLHIEGNQVTAISPEGKTADLPLKEFVNKLTGRKAEVEDLVYPDGTKTIRTRGRLSVIVHETPPHVYGLKWIRKDSPAPFGSDATYRTVRVSLPYLVTFLVFRHGPGSQTFQLSDGNECFFRTSPMGSIDDKICFPGLLNCSKFTPPDGKPLSWICTQHLNFTRVNKEPTPSRRVRVGFRTLMRTLLETGFNYSSEHHEGMSWFSESKGVDPRVKSIEAWEQATAKDALFTLEVPWLKTGLSVGQLIDRIFRTRGALNGAELNSQALARLVFNSNRTSR